MTDSVFQTSTLERWLAQASLTVKAKSLHIPIPSLETNDESGLAMKLLSYFGLRGPRDLAQFLKSPAGNSLKERVSLELNTIESNALNQKRYLQEKAYKHHLKLVFLLLGLMHYREVKAERLRQLIEQDIEHRLHPHKQGYEQEKELKIAHQYYTEAEQALFHEMNHYKTQSNQIVNELDELSQKTIVAEDKYNLFEKHLAKIHPLEDEIEKYLAEQHDATQRLLPTLKRKLSDLTKKIHLGAKTLGQHLDQGNEQKAEALLTKTQARHLRLAALEDMLSVVNGQKHLYTASCDPTCSFKKAAFVMKKEHKVVKDEKNCYYFLPSDAQLNALTFEQRHRAEIAFQRQKPHLTSIRLTINDNRAQEQKHYEAQRKVLEQKKDMLDHQLDAIKNQLTKVQLSKALVEDQLNNIGRHQTGAERALLTPKLTPSHSNPKKDETIHKKYERLVTQCYNQSQPLPEPAIVDLKAYLSKIDDPKLRRQLQGLSAEKPLTPEEMKALLSLDIPGSGKERVIQMMFTYGLNDEAMPSPFRMHPKPHPSY